VRSLVMYVILLSSVLLLDKLFYPKEALLKKR
ncbi:MAG: hypothetical protein ACI8UX_000825, partial [Psychromonas sp.]